MKKLIKESFAGGVTSPVESASINYLKSNPVVKDIAETIKKDKSFKGVELVRIQEDGDVYHIDLRFQIENPDAQTQYVREEGKHKAYDIKRKLEVELSLRHNIPSFSIAGVRIVTGPRTYCEFSISFIYANKGNLKPTNESLEKDRRVRLVVETALKVKKQVKNNKDPLKEAIDNISETDLEGQLAEWKKLSLQIKEHEDAFKKMISSQKELHANVTQKVFDMMTQLNIKTKKVDGLTAKMIAGGFKSLGPSQTVKVAILMSKINEATKKVVEAEFAAATIQNPFSPHQSITFDKSSVEEGIGDTIKSGFSKLKSVVSKWYNGVKEMFTYINQLDMMQFTPQKDEMYEEVPGSKVTKGLTPGFQICPDCDGDGYTLYSCCGDDMKGDDYGICPSCHEHTGDEDDAEECESCEGLGEIPIAIQESEKRREAALTFLERMGEVKRPEKG